MSSMSSKLSLLKKAGNKVIMARRMDHSWSLPETVFDSPLQQAIHVLQELGHSLEEAGNAESAEMAQQAVRLLHSKNLQQVPSEVMEGVDEMAHGWLEEVLPAGRPPHTPGTV